MKYSLSVSRSVAAALACACLCVGGCGEQTPPAPDGARPAATDERPDTDPDAGIGDGARPALARAMPAHLIDPPTDPRAALTAALASGLLGSDDSPNEKLRAVLQAAGVAEASQVLVFSKTSLQDRLITPTRPRAIYFNDDCYIGYVPGGVFEYGDADPDPKVGSGLFALDPDAGHDAALTANATCLNCHGGSRTNNRPGFLVRSVFPDEDGFPITSAGSTLVGHDTPIDKRWGGWYVTGEHGDLRHLGNLTAVEADDGRRVVFDRGPGANVTDLSPYFNTDHYLQPTSDIVALMVLEHQVQMHNLLTQGSSAVHERIAASRSLAKYLDEPFDPAKNDTLQRVIDANAERIVRHLLFCDEVELENPIVGSPDFQRAFRTNRREDSEGRSLKDFDLRTRMFTYRCSYMVYSRAFELMPDLLKDRVVAKLRAVLEGSAPREDFTHLDEQERQAIAAILSETTDWYRPGGDLSSGR
jgi:hypothetical protein